MDDYLPAKPRDAAALILLEESTGRVLWARRNPKLKFLGGFHSFPGGKLDEDDSVCPVRNCDDENLSALIACAAREAFEEVGVLLVRNGDKLTQGQIVSLHDDLISGRSLFSEILDQWGLWIDALDFEFSGIWTTPEFSPVRFRTIFFHAKCPPKQRPYAAITELQEVEFIEASSALRMWSDSSVLIAPPVLTALRSIIRDPNVEEMLSDAFTANAVDAENNPQYIELNSRLICVPLRTKTLPPATHTNCFIAGKQRFVVIDAATPYPEEQKKLFEVVDEMINGGNKIDAIIVSHLHPDHYGGETALKQHISDKFGIDVPISGHQITIKSLAGKVAFDKRCQDTYILQDSTGKEFAFETHHTPGHARGHLCFYDPEHGFLLSSDNVVGQGTVVIAPPEGNMIDYLESLNRMRSLPGLKSMCGSHGSAILDAKKRIEYYIEHRLEREKTIFEVIESGSETVEDIVSAVYKDLDPKLIPLAAKSVEAHLEKLISEGVLPASRLDIGS